MRGVLGARMSDLPRLKLGLPRLEIDTDVTPGQAASLLERVQAKWHRLGQTRPHWSTNARDAFLPGRIDANREAFERSGMADRDDLLAALDRHGFGPTPRAHVCDFGCGVGRVSLPLAQAFRRVTACDISPAHMMVGRAEAARQGRANIVFSLVTIADFGMTTDFDVWYSHLVLQHNPPPVIAMILRRMFALLAPGGLAYFQVPTYREGYAFRAEAALAAPPPDEDFEIHAIPQSTVFSIAAGAGCQVLEVREDSAVWPPSLVISNTFVFRKQSASC